MIIVNNIKREWRKGMTVQSLVDEKKYSFIVELNGKLIRKSEYDNCFVNDGDTIFILYSISGG